MDPSHPLMHAYVTDQSEAAFRELVERELGLVYGVALRRTGGDEGMAREIAQVVFIDLARKANSFSKDVVIAGWLHRHTGFTAAKMIRTEQRRRQREHTAALEYNPAPPEQTTLWENMAPLLDEVLERLPPEDRDALLLRYLEGRGLREVGISLGISENTARMRVTRALEKLRQALQRRGVTSTALALTGALALTPRLQAPEGWAGPMAGLALKMAPAPLAAGALATAAGGGGLLMKGAAVLAAAGVIGGGAFLYKHPPRPGAEPRGMATETQRPSPVGFPDPQVREIEARPVEMALATPAPAPAPPVVVVAAPVAVAVPAPVAVAVQAPVGERGDHVKLMLGVVPAMMKFTPELLTVPAGRPVVLFFQNEKCPLQHNFILAKPGTLDGMGALADQLITDPQAMAQHYLPASPDILAQSSRLVGLGQSDLIEFTAPAEPGDYPFLCTFPGHWRMMHGVLRVVP